MRREFLSAAIGLVDLVGDWLDLGAGVCDAVCERLCQHYDLIPSGTHERATILKES